MKKFLHNKAKNRFSYLATTATSSIGDYKNVKGNTFRDKEHRFICNHSYSISEVIENGNDFIIHIVNPHNSIKIEPLHFEKFSEYFHRVDAAGFCALEKETTPYVRFKSIEIKINDEEYLEKDLSARESIEIDHIGKEITLSSNDFFLIGTIERLGQEYFLRNEISGKSYPINDRTSYPIGRWAI